MVEAGPAEQGGVSHTGHYSTLAALSHTCYTHQSIKHHSSFCRVVKMKCINSNFDLVAPIVAM